LRCVTSGAVIDGLQENCSSRPYSRLLSINDGRVGCLRPILVSYAPHGNPYAVAQCVFRKTLFGCIQPVY
jgi:hypothetical protein